MYQCPECNSFDVLHSDTVSECNSCGNRDSGDLFLEGGEYLRPATELELIASRLAVVTDPMGFMTLPDGRHAYVEE